MKSAVFMLFIIFFVGVAVYGFAGVFCVSGSIGWCSLAELVQGVKYPQADHLFAFLNFDLNALKSFSVATVYEAFFALMSLIVSYGFVTFFKKGFFGVARPRLFLASWGGGGDIVPALAFENSLLRWLALRRDGDVVFG